MRRGPDDGPRNAGRRRRPATGSIAPISCSDLYRRLIDTVDLATLPPPPADGAEWRERSFAVFRRVPGLRAHIADAPIGWFPLLERAAQEACRLLPTGQRLVTSQVKEKFGALRWYAHVETGLDEHAHDDAALGAVEWAETVSAKICAVFGTPDGAIDQDGGWLLTLSPAARTLRQDDRRGRAGMARQDMFSHMLYPTWMHEA
jgi:hypothetical protein